MWGWVNHEYHENLAILNSIDSTVLCGFVQIHFTDVHLSDDYCLNWFKIIIFFWCCRPPTEDAWYVANYNIAQAVGIMAFGEI